MKLILFRHGLAVEREEFQKKKQDDSLRPLVAKGKERTLKMAKYLQQIFPEIDLLVSSPYVRSTQTADIIKKTMKPAQYRECVELIPSAPQIAFANWLRANAATARTVLAVGHSPQLDVFASWCLAGLSESFLSLKKSGVLVLEIEDFAEITAGKAELQMLLHPKMLGLFSRSSTKAGHP